MVLKAPIQTNFQYGNQLVKIEAGHLAHQATSSVIVTVGKCIIMANVVRTKSDRGNDFFPLAVHYSERAYSAGKIPGSFNRREGRPSTREILTCRVIDRALRPMFAEGFTDETIVNITLLQNDKTVQPDIAGFIAASAALAFTDMPFQTIGAARVGLIDDAFVLNPDLETVKSSQLDLIIAGTTESFVMIESGAKELSEEQMQAAMAFGHQAYQTIIAEINNLKQAHGFRSTWEASAPAEAAGTTEKLREAYGAEFEKALTIPGKIERNQQLKTLQASILDTALADADPSDATSSAQIIADTETAFYQIKKQIIRRKALDENLRIDGRSTTDIRPLTVIPGFLSETHGSALFIRGETQALVTTTLSAQDSSAQLLDDITSSVKQYDNFMLHYNMPGYSVGEGGQPMSPKRREIGHGELAKRALMAVMPTEAENYGYVTRVVSEILSCNGSSSMATICGGSLALMDAGVPISASVAGIAMGLIKEENNYAVLSDILGDEDAFGDMDFKVAGTRNGITALQMDIKIDGVTEEILATALNQAKEGRLHILEAMDAQLPESRGEISSNAPRVIQFNIPVSKIREVIGRGGATIKDIIEKFSVSIDISDEGLVKLSSDEEENSERAKAHIEEIVRDVELGKVYEGKVTDILDFGAKVAIMKNKEAFLHISQVSHSHIENIRNELSSGQIIKVRVAEIDKRQNRIKLSMKDVVQ